MLPPASHHADGQTTPAARDNSYVLGSHGFVYTSQRIASGLTSRHAAVLLLSADYQAFALTPEGGDPLRTTAVVVAPQVLRSLDARGVALLSFNITPLHHAFYVFSAMRRPGVMEVDRHAFSGMDDAFHALGWGLAGIADASAVFDQVVAKTALQLPPAKPPDAKARAIIRALEGNPELTIDELSRQLGHSPQVMARLFTAAVGMSLRDYQGWLKQRRLLGSLCLKPSLTDVALSAGFSDSPQFSRTFQRWYGQSPSFSRDPKFVRVVSASAPAGVAVTTDATPPEALFREPKLQDLG